MRTDASLQELLDPEELAAAYERVCGTSGEFMEIKDALDLDPARDFRFADLRDVDFSNADLRGFDFTGADLRGGHGTDVTFDESTIFADADLQGSCFATHVREMTLFRQNPMAERMYRALLEGDPMEISSWLHARYRNGREEHSILRKADSVTASILCQKMLSEDIDLTKRTDLFYFLRSITSSPMELRELLLGIFARHSTNASVIEKFTTIASILHGKDPNIRTFILQLCDARSPKVRLAAFKASINIGLFMRNFQAMRGLFMSARNASIRRELILESATALGRHHVGSVNRSATLEGVRADDVLDVPDLFDDTICTQIAIAIRRRHDEIEERMKQGGDSKNRAPEDPKLASPSIIFEQQAEVLCNAPVLSAIFAKDDPHRSMSAQQRLSRRAEREQWRRDDLAQRTMRSRRRYPRL